MSSSKRLCRDPQMAYLDAQGNQIPLPPDVWEATHPAARQFIPLLLEQNRALRGRRFASSESRSRSLPSR
jgi:hypothetical protein